MTPAPLPRSAPALLALAPAELMTLAPGLFTPAVPGSHWSQLAVVVGRIEAEALYHPRFETARAYCADQLGLPPRDTEELLKLWAMVTRHRDRVSIERWERVPKSHAMLLRQLLSLGADPVVWLDTDCTAADLQDALERQRGRDPWVTVEFVVPAATAALVDQALTLAIRELGLEALGLDALADRSTRHQLLEALARSYILGEARTVKEPREQMR